MSCLASLPYELIMHHITIQERMSSCCLVSRKFHAAAVAATGDLDFMIEGRCSYTYLCTDSILEWLSHYGQHLTRLSLTLGYYPPQPLRELDCPNLLELKLGKCDVQLGAEDGFPGVVQGCSKLTRLELECNILEAPEGSLIYSLADLVHLQHLQVVPGAFGIHFAGRYSEFKVAGLCCDTMSRLQHLTYLRVDGLGVESLLQLGGLTNLQELHLVDSGVDVVDPSSIPGLAFPASLKTLLLLSRVEAGLLSLLPPGLQDLRIDDEVWGPEDGPDSFLSHLVGLNLTQLSLQRGHTVNWPAYSALTANSNLVVLEMHDAYLPSGVWPHVFAPMQKLPHLTSLVLWGSDGGDPAAPPPCCAADLSSIVSCCPSLCAVETDNLEPGVHVSELRKLTALTRLRLGSRLHDSDDAEHDDFVEGLAAVTQLKEVDITGGPVLSLLPLTSLTVLTSLSCGRAVSLHTSAQAGSAPDVWLKLLARCAAEPDSQPPVLCSLAQQLAEQRALGGRQQQQIADLQERLSAQQQAAAEQLAGLQERLSAQQQLAAQQSAGLQEQVSAQQQAAAQQGSQIAALHAQLQELLQRHT